MEPSTKGLVYRSLFAYEKSNKKEKKELLKILEEKINVHHQLFEMTGNKTQTLIAGQIFMRIIKNKKL